ncbi:MAG: substrate-binding domain-containing protein [Bacteroidota bacterium]
MVFIFHNPEERSISLHLALMLEEAGISAELYSHSDKKANAQNLPIAKAVILILSPLSVTTFDQYHEEIEIVQHSKKVILPLLYGMSRAEFDTKQTPWRKVVGPAASIQLKEETIGEVIPKLVSALKGIGTQQNATPDAGRIHAIRKELSAEKQISSASPVSSVPSALPRKRFPVMIISGIILLLAGLIGGYLYLHRTVVPEELTVLRIHGSNTIGAKLIPALVEGYIRHLGGTSVQWKSGSSHLEKYVHFTHTDSLNGMVIEVFAHGSSFAFRDLGDEKCDIGMSSREIKNDEAILLQSRGLGNMLSMSNEHVLALDGLGIVVHPSNPVRSLTIEQVGKIFSGEIVNWKPITGENATIKLYARDTNSGTHETFQHLVLKRIQEDHISGDAAFYEDTDELSKAVSRDPAAIGFLGFAYAKDNKIVAISEGTSDGLFANFLTIGREDYLLTRRLFLYTSSTPVNPLVRDFIQYALSEEGQKIVHANKFVDQNVRVENNPALPENVPADYAVFVKDAKRVSVNFRFQKGKDLLDTKAAADLERVVDFLKENGNPQVKLIGFSDNEGSKEENELISKERAEMIAQEFKARGINIPGNNIAGFGSQIAITTNKTPEGRMKNRRVEVWLQ